MSTKRKMDLIATKNERGGFEGFSWQLPLLVIVLLTGLLLRGLYLREIIRNPDFANPAIDASYHDYWARGLVTKIWVAPRSREDAQIYRYPFYRPPGYAYFLSLIYFLFRPNYLAPRLLQMALGLGSALLAFFLGKRWWGRVVGLIFAFLMSTYWVFIYFEGELVGVVLAVFLGLLLVMVLARLTERISSARFLIAGLILGVLVLVRPNILAFLPVAALWVMWLLQRRGKMTRWPVAALSLLLGTAVPIAPVTVRNYLVSKEFVPIATNLGVSLRVANNKFSDGTTHVIPEIGDIGTPYDWPRIVRHLERKLNRSLTHSEASAYLSGRALRFMRENPGKFMRLLGRKALLFWGPGEIRNLKEIHFARKHSKVLRVIPVNFPFVVAIAMVGVLLLLLDIKKNSNLVAAPQDAGRRLPSTEFMLSVAEVLPSASLRVFEKSAATDLLKWRDRKLGGEDSQALRRQFEVLTLVLLFIGTYFVSMLPFAAAARYRVPVIPFLLCLGAYGLKRIGEFCLRREWPKLTFWVVMGAVFYILFSRNISGYKPSPEKWHYDLALAYTEKRDWDNAIREYQEAIKLKPGFFQAYNNLGNVYLLRGHYQKAAKYYEHVIRLQPNLAQAHCNLGSVLYKQGEIMKAIERFKRALQLRPDLVEAQNNLGAAFFKLQRFNEAIKHYEQALEYKPSDVNVRVNLGRTLARQGRVEEAIRHLEIAVRLQPGFKPARSALEQIKRQYHSENEQERSK